MPPSNTGSFAIAALTAAAFMLLLLVVTAVARVKKVPLPFTPPRLPVIIQWVCLFAVVAIVEEMVGGYLGGKAAPRWDALTPARALRAATIILLAPLAEEVAFRGTMFGALVKKGARPAVAVLLPAAVFALVHFQYFGIGLVIIFADGVLFGLARHRTESLFVPVLLHTLGNAYAVAERIL